MSLSEILTQCNLIKTDISNGQFLKAWEDSLVLQQAVIDLGKSVGFHAAPGDETTAIEIKSCLDQCVVLCNPPAFASIPAVGKIGDGKILKILVDLFIKLAPIIIPLITTDEVV